MTAWQDQPPLNSQQLSRRQARQNERGEATDVQVDVAPQTPEQSDFVGFAREGWDTEARRVAASAPAQRDGAPQTGRRSQRALHTVESSSDDQQTSVEQPSTAAEATAAEAEAEPLTYLTQGRQQLPSVDGQNFRRRAVSAVPDAAAEPVPYRVRDFSPEGRRSAFSSTTPEAPAGPADLEYRTQGSPLLPAPQFSGDSPSVHALGLDDHTVDVRTVDVRPIGSHPADVAVEDQPTPIEERTLSRREIRALENARAAQNAPDLSDADEAANAPSSVAAPFSWLGLPPASPEAAAPTAASIPDLVEPIQPPLRRSRIRALSTEQDYSASEALAEFDALTGQGSADELVEAEANSEPAAVQAELVEQPAAEPPVVEQAKVEQPNIEQANVEQPNIEQAAAPTVEPKFIEPQGARVESVAPVNPFDSLLTGSSDRPTSYTPPVGHWSTQASIDDDEQAQESTQSRNIGATSGAITTNALVIPTMPLEDALKPFGSTGEILITGSIDLPRSLGSTGSHPARYDHSDVDALLEAGDREDSNSESAPVRAIRAVSTHTSTRGVMDSKKPRGNSRLPMILAVAAAVMVVAVVVLVVTAVMSGTFK
jgi:hypothetical protein